MQAFKYQNLHTFVFLNLSTGLCLEDIVFGGGSELVIDGQITAALKLE